MGAWVVLGGPHRSRKHLAAGALGGLPEGQGCPMVGRSVLGSGPASPPLRVHESGYHQTPLGILLATNSMGAALAGSAIAGSAIAGSAIAGFFVVYFFLFLLAGAYIGSQSRDFSHLSFYHLSLRLLAASRPCGRVGINVSSKAHSALMVSIRDEEAMTVGF